MKKPPSPSSAAKARLQKLGEPAIAEFISDVSDLRNLVQYLPTVPGFRKNSQAGIDRQRKELARRICSRATKKSGPEDRDYRALYVVWRAWVLERLGERKPINAAIDTIEEASGAPDRDTKKGDVEAATLALFTLFQKSSENGKCSREDIKRAFQFSLYDETQPLLAIIELSRSAADIKRTADYEGLPNRLSQDEDEIKAAKAQLKDIGLRLDRLATAADAWPIHRTGLLSAIDDLRVSVERRLETLEAARNDLPSQKANGSQTEQALAVKNLNDRVDAVTQQLAALPADKSTEAGEAAERANKRLDIVEAALAESENGAIADVEAQIKAVEDRLDREIKVRLAGTTDPSILERLNNIEEALTGNPPPQPQPEPPQPQPQPQPHYETKTPSGNAVIVENAAPILVEPLVQRADIGSTTASTFATIAAPLSAMFQNLGLKASAAEILAEEVCAALIMGQVVFLKGAYATEAARACASLLCHGNAYRLALPLGLQKADDLRRSVQSQVVVDNQQLTAVVIEGINLVAFEICKDVLSDLATDGAPSATGEIGGAFVIATIVQGIASLPVEASYLELGPVLDLDYLDWRSKRPVARDATVLTLSRAAALAVRTTLTAKSVDTDEPQKLVQSFQPKRNPRIEHTVLSAFTALATCRKTGVRPSALQSLAFGWLLPLWVVQAAPKSEVDIQIDGGKCDADTPDPRLTLLLEELGAGQERGGS
jgi:hypothetical protein